MKKQLYFLVSVMVSGLLIVGVTVYWQTNRIHGLISMDSTLSSQIYIRLSAVGDLSEQVQIQVASAYLTKMEAEIELIREKVLGQIDQINDHMNKLESTEFSRFHDAMIQWDEGVGEDSKPTQKSMKETLASVHEGLIIAKGDLEKYLQSRKEHVETVSKLEKKRLQLSKTYRASFDLKSYGDEGFADLSRSVITVLSSSSNRDLNFAGRSVFEEATKFYSAKKLKPQHAEMWENLKSQFNETFELANRASSASNDFHLFKDLLMQQVLKIDGLKTFAKNVLNESQDTAVAKILNTKNLSILVALLMTILCVAIAYVISKRLIGSFTIISSKLGVAGNQVTESSGLLKTTSEKLSSGAAQSASSLEETVASLAEISAMVQTNSTHAKSCFELAANTSKIAQQGQIEVQSLVTSVREIHEQSKKIQDIVVVIDDIAFQINLLSLNAAVEAARAGDQGKGFAVVADAVRTLAQKSADAAKNIKSLIDESSVKAQSGVSIADQSDQVLAQIVEGVEKLRQFSESIAVASEEQTVGLDQINEALNAIDSISQSNALSAQSTAISSEGLSEQASKLNNVVKDLDYLVGVA